MTEPQTTGLIRKLESGAAATDRDRLLDEAIAAGKITEQSRATYAAMYDRDANGTRKLIERLEAAPMINHPVLRTGLFPKLD